MSYNALLMLSGGKDSCSLALKLKEQKINFLCFTLDTGFLSDIAWDNIKKITKLIDVDSLVFRPKPGQYIKLIQAKMSLKETCGICSLTTFNYALGIAGQLGIETIYAGFTKFTAQAQGWGLKNGHIVNDITIKYPYLDDYNYQEIKQTLINAGIEYDPTKTNCQYIKELISRDKDNCFEKEIDLMLEAKQINEKDYEYYAEFLKSCRVH